MQGMILQDTAYFVFTEIPERLRKNLQPARDGAYMMFHELDEAIAAAKKVILEVPKARLSAVSVVEFSNCGAFKLHYRVDVDYDVIAKGGAGDGETTKG